MAVQALVLLVSALFVQDITGQCIGNSANLIQTNNANNVIDNGITSSTVRTTVPGLNGLTFAELSASNGGPFTVTSTSPIAPTGVNVLADNLQMEGPLSVNGQLPFLGIVAMKGPLEAGGQAAISFGSGNGDVGITSETSVAAANGGIGVSGSDGGTVGVDNAASYGSGLGNIRGEVGKAVVYRAGVGAMRGEIANSAAYGAAAPVGIAGMARTNSPGCGHNIQF